MRNPNQEIRLYMTTILMIIEQFNVGVLGF